MITLTESLVVAGMKSGIGINKAQAEMLGAEYPLKAGWKDRLIGSEVHEDTYAVFINLKGVRGKAKRKKIILDGVAHVRK